MPSSRVLSAIHPLAAHQAVVFQQRWQAIQQLLNHPNYPVELKQLLLQSLHASQLQGGMPFFHPIIESHLQSVMVPTLPIETVRTRRVSKQKIRQIEARIRARQAA